MRVLEGGREKSDGSTTDNTGVTSLHDHNYSIRATYGRNNRPTSTWGVSLYLWTRSQNGANSQYILVVVDYKPKRRQKQMWAVQNNINVVKIHKLVTYPDQDIKKLK